MQKQLSIGCLTLITSCGCNLKCEYCQIAKSVNEDSSRLQKETIKALQDGSFLTNTLQALSRVNQSPASICHISLWGQEPTLTLHYLTEHIEDWLIAFPNLDGIMFSSNMMDYPERIVDFIRTIENKTNKPFNIDVQMSFDGEESTDNIRNASSKKIFNNISYVFNELNKINFRWVNPTFHFHGVVSIDLINRLDTFDKVLQYYKNLDDWSHALAKINTNKAVEIAPMVGLALENPVNASTEDGLNLNRFFKMSVRINSDNFIDPFMRTSAASLMHQYQHYKELLRAFNVHSISELLEQMEKDPEIKKEINFGMSQLMFCGNGFSELKLMYDGSCVNCQNSIFETDSKYIQEDGSIEVAVKKSLADNNYYINLITASDEEIEKYFDLFRTSRTASFSFMFQSVATLMWWLAKARQIDESYRDLNKLLEHAFVLAWVNTCYYNHYVRTGSMFMKHAGIIRFYCNGFMDNIMNYYTNEKGGFR